MVFTYFSLVTIASNVISKQSKPKLGYFGLELELVIGLEYVKFGLGLTLSLKLTLTLPNPYLTYFGFRPVTSD